MIKIKIDGEWQNANLIFLKSGGTWSSISSGDVVTYISGKPLVYGGFKRTDTLTINGLESVTGESCSYSAVFNKTLNVTSGAVWSVQYGGQYASFSQTGGVLTIDSSATGSTVIISAEYDGVMATKTLSVTFASGTTATTNTEIETDASGNTTTIVTTTTTYEDGSSKVDEAVEDKDGNVSDRVTETDASGNSVVTSYSIDTSGNESGTGKEVAEGVNTEFVPLDGSGDGFEMHIRFKSIPTEQPNPPIVTDTEDTGANYHFHLISAMSAYRPWPGFMIRWSLNKNNYSNGSMQVQFISSGGTKEAKTITTAAGAPSDGLYDFTISYDPNKIKYDHTLKMTDNINSTTFYNKDAYLGDNDLDFTIGYAISQAGISYRYSNLTVYDFTITKLTSS